MKAGMNYSSYLKQNALWLIMDPWTVQRSLGKQNKHTKQQDYINKYFAELIAWKLESNMVQHKAVSIPGYNCQENLHVISPHFDGYTQLHTPESVVDYCKEHNINSIVYTGFHVGKCIVNNVTGTINMKTLGFKTYLAVDLSCVLKNTKTGCYPFALLIEQTAEHCQLI